MDSKKYIADALIKPALRGHFHQATFFLALGACLMLIEKTINHSALVTILIYSLSQIFLFGTSALYHRVNWNPSQRKWMRRLDHAAIYFSIAGSGTPIIYLSLPGHTSTQILYLIWGCGILGFLQSLFWITAPKWLSSILYVVAGLLITPFIGDLKNAIPPSIIFLILSGGVVYIVGAIIYATKKPNPNPKYFGYHEIFHLLVVIGAILHFMAINKLLNIAFLPLG